ncbi:hypothetical protein BDZ94DRAFT_1269240 [Collybia nuda]|uniref:Uncharacterized protein n=1 Tax=Collybia nuda TaxID=64659 RepID=A0A9P5XWK0_9AGAR|nr:hypothetical protein BDZ94DRAFT_1269240 [Collybia nuda]
MSDEYAGPGYKGSLVNKTVNVPSDKQRKGQNIPSRKQQNSNDDFDTLNYPASDDTTSSGGYGSPTNVWSDRSQRGYMVKGGSYKEGLIDQSLSGGDLKGEIQDAKQGRDNNTRRAYRGVPAIDKGRGDLLNPTFDEDDGEF